ncbi:hypothetical protein L227DRAFT_374746 [Lentinus tigrinus ALCF2SS1-6]|uniref:Uncharacterized protein n=1 Tax=Lentinus tigrinus ALCF2SS1-6 TaxID=1328759 RepID=A0A5C2RTP0_9APHY|nr:hypothetical protein L227DRAFT_374746 [Lentinus tigrinus ALCF2SS1-6]
MSQLQVRGSSTSSHPTVPSSRSDCSRRRSAVSSPSSTRPTSSMLRTMSSEGSSLSHLNLNEQCRIILHPQLHAMVKVLYVFAFVSAPSLVVPILLEILLIPSC